MGDFVSVGAPPRLHERAILAAEFAFVRIRPTQANALVGEGRAGAATVREAVENLDDYLAVCQIGITSPRSGSAGSASRRSRR